MQGLNVNGRRGTTKEIRIRLRYHHSPSSFYPYEDILGTMLHEITHNVQGPHDAKFYSILDELTKECEEFMAKGVTGTGSGFDGPSMGRLGAHSWIPQHNLDPAAMKAAQLKYVHITMQELPCPQVSGHIWRFINIEKVCRAAKKRAAQQAIMSQGPQRLGGSSSTAKTMTPREAAAAAAERRARDNLWCPSAAIAAGEATVIDLVGDSEDETDTAVDFTPSDPSTAANIPSKPRSGKLGAVHQQNLPKTLHRGGVGATGKQVLSGASNMSVPARSVKAVPVLRSPAVDSIAGKAGAAAAARAEATRSQHMAAFGTPMQTETAAKRRKQCVFQAQQKESAERARNWGALHGGKAEVAGQAWCAANTTMTSHTRTGLSANVSRAPNSADDADDDDDDLEIVGVCCCGHAAAHPPKPMQRPAFVPLQMANVQDQSIQEMRTDDKGNFSVVGWTSSGMPTPNASHCSHHDSMSSAHCWVMLHAGRGITVSNRRHNGAGGDCVGSLPLAERTVRCHAAPKGTPSSSGNSKDTKGGLGDVVDLT